MNIFLWVLQVLLALHTAAGAVWKFSHSAGQTMPSLATIPQEIWIGMSVVELLCSLALILPAVNKFSGTLVPAAAVIIAAEMLLFSVMHLAYGAASVQPVVYWITVAAVCGFIAYGRYASSPLQS
ncbi:DoxX family protein [Fodinibius sediminis]